MELRDMACVRALSQEFNTHLWGKWTIDDHDVQVEFYLRSLESPFVSGNNIVANLSWVEAYVQNGQVVNLGSDAKPTYPSFDVLADFTTKRLH
ncbi:hypothetical protein EYZ11_011955 [Aspergillus tanneri]|uniref:Uncharacterized protein n=1 Tax=Aspergillus tanneri TaxID=1220188 RepID=A0A4S3J1G6_9EURO|nr:hypothetical protein EYZ11_011955 [Aspergillus tanneri]